MENYKSNKQEQADPKKRSGDYPVNEIKSVNKLPTPFKTDLNKKWLDATFDQMISKGDMENVDAFVGNMSGKSLIRYDDNYLNTNSTAHQLEPGIITTDELDNVTHTISVSDIANSVAMNFDEYSYNAAYNSNAYVYAPPINIDKFVNFVSYYWAAELPVYESTFSVAGDDNPITTITGAPLGTITDSENTVELFNGLKIKFIGYDAAIADNTYLVTGVGTRISFKLLIDSTGQKFFTDTTPYSYSIESVAQVHTIKDYIVIDTSDNIASSWSRANHWVHKDSILYLETLITSFVALDSCTIENRAKRPIIQFDTLMHMTDHGHANYATDVVFKGQVDYVLSDLDATGIALGSRIATGNGIYIKAAADILTEVERTYTFTDGDTFVTLNDSLSGTGAYTKSDMYYDGEIKLAQNKALPNTAPLFKLCDHEGTSLSSFNGSSFVSSKVFSYKVGTGTVDSELNFAISYKDSGTGANIVFENNLFTERYTYSRDMGHVAAEIPGYYFFVKGMNNASTYIPSSYSMGAKDSIQLFAEDSIITVPVGYGNWRVDKEFLVFERDGNITTTEVLSEGVYNRSRTNQPELILGKDTSYVFHDITPAKDLTFYNTDGSIFPTSVIGEEITVTLPDEVSFVLEFGSASDSVLNRGRIITNLSQDEFFHTVYVNGRKLPASEYDINETTIEITDIQVADEQSNFATIDVEYYNNDTTRSNAEQTQIPDVHLHNANNELVTEFTIQETLSHWLSIIESTPGFVGDAFGDNNYHSSIIVKSYAGEIFLHDDISIMHDLCYGIDEMNIATALFEQGRDWWSFKQRVMAQTKRLYKTKPYNDVRALTTDVIDAMTQSHKGTAVHKNSNMLYSQRSQYVEVAYIAGTVDYHLGITLNNDDFRKDHMYLYCTDNRDGDNIAVTHLLTLGKDYTLDGSKITLISIPVEFTDIQFTSIRSYYYQMDADSNVPASMAKLGLSHTYVPQVLSNELIGHDGSVYTLKANAELAKINDINFDPVAAVLYDIETRVYNGMRKQDSHYANSFVKYLPSQHRGTWYTLNKIDNYVDKYFKDWYTKTAQTTLNPANYFDALDSTTWNYSSISITEGHLKSNLPGHWKGAYNVLFGTTTPHITPWHMLGYSDKPSWWDENYSWTDPTKRTAMLSAFNTGLVSEPSTPIKQDLYFARYYWDFATKSPVTVTGLLEDPAVVLGTPTDLDKATPFVFGDWAPVEFEWRNSSLGHAAMVDAVVKLNPTKAWTDFFQTSVHGSFTNITGMNIDRFTKGLITTTMMYDNTNNKAAYIDSISVLSSDSSFEPDTEILISGGGLYYKSTATLDFDLNFKIIGVTLTSRGGNYQTKPTIELRSATATAKLADKETYPGYVAAKATFNANVNHDGTQYRPGINQVQTSYAQRNFFDDVFTTNYILSDTRLLQQLGGFTAPHLMKIETETGSNGKYTLNQLDAPLIMYTSSPSDVHVACNITITKNATSYTVDGITNHKQQFKFLEPRTSNVNDHININLNDTATIKKYKYFSDVVSIAEYEAQFVRIQDVYNFIRGNYAYLDSVGYQFGKTGDGKAFSFAQWAITASVDDTYIIPIDRKISFANTSHVVLEYNTLPGKLNSILNEGRHTIEASDLLINRDTNSLTVETKPGVTAIASIGTAMVTHEHAFLFNNVTQFNETVFDDVTNVRQLRLKLIGQRTRNWTGAKQAPGFLVRDNTIMQNFDSTVEEISNFYDFNVDKFNKQITKAENLMLNNVNRDWVSRLSLSDTAVSKFFQGVIKAKGTKSVIQSVARSKLINDGRSTINIDEEFMFRQGNFGDTTITESTEIEITPSDVVLNPSVIDFSSSDIVFVNKVNAPIFDVKSYEENVTTLLTAGDLLDTEADNVIYNISELETLFDATSDYANIDTWNNSTSYKFGNEVRLDGNLWNCNVDYIGLSNTPSDLAYVGTVNNPIFPHRNVTDDLTTPSASIDGVDIWFNKTQFVYDSIVAESIASPSVLSPSTVIVDGFSIDLISNALVTVIDTDSYHEGNPYSVTAVNPSSLDVTGLTLDINATIVNLEDYGTYVETLTPGTDTTESFNATVAPVSSITLTSIMTAHHVGTIDVVSGGITSPYTLATSDYTYDSNTQVITFNTPIADGDDADGFVDITVNLLGFSSVYTMDKPQLKLAISSVANVTGVDNEQDALRVSILYDAAGDINAQLIIAYTTGLSEFGILTGTYNATTTQEIQSQSMDETYIAAVIDAALSAAYNVTVVSNKVKIEKVATASFTQLTTLEIDGEANSTLLFPSTTTSSGALANVVSDAQDAVDFINTALLAASISNVTASVIGNRVSIVSTNTEINLGNRELNTLAGLETGIYYSSTDVTVNVFDEDDWINISDEDEALFNIWMPDDNEFINGSTGTIPSKFFSWNVLQVQQFGYHASITAGTDTDDGNDAQVSLNAAHNVEVGDYIMLVNTTTTPNIDGIHRVTKLGNIAQPGMFYIDRFIELDGTSESVFVLRSARFNRLIDINETLVQSTPLLYNWNVGDLVWSTTDSVSGDAATQVYKFNGTAFVLTRENSTRVTNAGIANVLIYDGESEQTINEMEIFDPLRGIIPGVADKELDFKTPVDFAVYNTSTDIAYNIDERNSWGKAEIGRTWWDTSKVRYYDYEQGDNAYRAKMWGKQFPNSSIDVYEWTKSSVHPEEWNEAVINSTVQYGVEATGEVYSVFDKTLNENLYYFATLDEWNDKLKKYDVTYYFWVKNKTNTEGNHSLSVKQIASIISNPTDNGIAWCAAIDDNAMIVNNVKYMINDKSSVLQINMKSDTIAATHSESSHTNWTAIKENIDNIPEYWYIGLRDNLTEEVIKTEHYSLLTPANESTVGQPLPSMKLHEYNRYGDDRGLSFDGKVYSQGWFKDTWNARREAIVAINALLKQQNLIQEFTGQWDRTIGSIIDPNGINLDMNTLWDYTNFVHESRNTGNQPTIEVTSYSELSQIDTDIHSIASFNIEGDIHQMDESEIFEWIDNEWLLVEKRNGTIAFNDIVYNKNLFNGWDGDNGFDGSNWDSNPAAYMQHIIYACRNDLFIEEHIKNFNKLFFAVVKFAVSEHDMVDWVYKTTYVHLNISTNIETGPNKLTKYNRSVLNEISGYINTVKPYHTKIKSVVESYNAQDNVSVSMEELDRKIKITMETFELLDHAQYDYENPIITSSFSTTPTDIVDGGSFTDTPTDVINSIEFISPTNLNNVYNEHRRSNVAPTFNESLSVKAITHPGWHEFTDYLEDDRVFVDGVYYTATEDHTSGDDWTEATEADYWSIDISQATDDRTRTYAYIQDNWLNTAAFSLREDRESTITTDMTYNAISITLATGGGVKFNALGGFAYIDGEIIQYTQASGDTLNNITRAMYGTINRTHSASTVIIDVTNEQLDIFKTLKTFVVNGQYGTSQRFDYITGESILDITAKDIESHELQASGKGVS